MRRSHWPSSVLFVLTVLIITTALLANILHVQATSDPPRRKLFVLIQGLNTSLQNNNPPIESFGTNGGIALYLRNKYPDAQFLMYSYNGDNGKGYPIPYQCQDTFATDAKADVFKLAKQLQNYLKDKTNVDVYLMAHSFGGLVAYGYLSYLHLQKIANGSIPGTTGGRIAGVVTLDAPLGGIPNDLQLARIFLTVSSIRQCPELLGQPMITLDALFTVYTTGKLLPHGNNNSIAKVLFDTNITNGAIASESARQGIHVLTVGNEYDYMFNPASCKLILGKYSVIGTRNYLSTQWVSGQGYGSGIYAHSFRDGIPTCEKLTDVGVNHGMVFIQRSVQTALGQFIGEESVTALPLTTQKQ